MMDFLTSLAARALEAVPVARPRLAPRFAPPDALVPLRSEDARPSALVQLRSEDQRAEDAGALGQQAAPRVASTSSSGPIARPPVDAASISADRESERRVWDEKAGEAGRTSTPALPAQGEDATSRSGAFSPAARLIERVAAAREPLERAAAPSPADPAPPAGRPISDEHHAAARRPADAPPARPPLPAGERPVAPHHGERRGDETLLVVTRPIAREAPPASLSPAEPSGAVHQAAHAQPAPTGEPAPSVHVTIGRIEVKATSAPDRGRVAQRRTAPAMSLDDYLRRRAGRGAP